MRLALPILLIALTTAVHPSPASAGTEDARACDAAVVVVQDYLKDGAKLALIGKPFGPQHGLTELEKNWRSKPPTSLLEAYRTRPVVGLIEGCANHRDDLERLGVEIDPAGWRSRPELAGSLQVGVAVIDETGTEALVQTSISFRGFGGHCLLSYLRRENGVWKIIDQRAICVV